MKKLFSILTLTLIMAFAFQANAQYCGSSQVTQGGCGAPPYGGNFIGFIPLDSIACIQQGAPTTLVIPFKNYTTFTAQGNTISIYRLRIDSMENLPCGLCWSSSSPTNEFYKGIYGCFQIQGTTNDAAGEYKIRLILSVETLADTTSYSGPTANVNADLGDVYLYLRVKGSGACAGVDTSSPGLTASCQTHVGINEVTATVSGLTIQPNPMSTEAKVTFTSQTTEAAQVKIMNVVGAEVYNASINAKAGMNETTISKNNLPAGMYILSVGSASGMVSRKFVIAE